MQPVPNSQHQIFINPQSILPKTYFNLIEKVGSDGKYQRNMFIIFLLVFLVTGSVLLSTSFMFLNNRYECQELGFLVSDCESAVCELTSQDQREKYFIQNVQKVNSVATQFGPFMCEQQYLLDIIKSCPYLGSFLGFIIFSYISDNFGRRTTMIITLSTATLGCALLTVGTNIPMIAIGVILAGAGINSSSGIVFYFLGETVENIKRQKYSIVVQTAYTFGSILVTSSYYLFHNWRIVVILLQTIPVVITLFFFVIYIEETPQFLLKGSNQKSLRALNRIGNINYKIKDILTEEDLQNVKSEQLATEEFNTQKLSPLDLIRFKSLRYTTIISCLLSFVVFAMYYGPALIIDSIGFDTYVSSYVIQISQMIGYIPCYFLIDKVKRVNAGIGLFSIAILCSFTLSFVQKPEGCQGCWQSIVEIVIVFFFRMAVAIQFILILVYAVQLFPTRIVGLGAGAVSVFGTLSSTLSPIILGALQRMQFNLMLYFSILGIVGLCLSMLLEQTQGKPLKVQIEQIRFAKNKRKSKYISQISSQEHISEISKDHVMSSSKKINSSKCI